MAKRKRMAHVVRQGPDMADVFPFWREVERTHQVRVSMNLEAEFHRYQGSFYVEFVVHPAEGYLQPCKDWPKRYKWLWPNVEGLAWEAFLYQKLHTVDWELSHSYEQRALLLFPGGMP